MIPLHASILPRINACSTCGNASLCSALPVMLLDQTAYNNLASSRLDVRLSEHRILLLVKRWHTEIHTRVERASCTAAFTCVQQQ